MIRVNAIGDVCPVPVIKTKKAMEQPGVSEVVVLVDNDIAMNNVKKMAISLGADVSVEKIHEQEIHVCINMNKDVAEKGSDKVIETEKKAKQDEVNVVVAISSKEMGAGDEKLGEVLMKGFLFAVSQLEELPKTILFYNGGALLTTKGSDSLEDLKFMEEEGVEILTCGTCLDFYGKKDQLEVGNVTNMYDIVEKLSKADKVIRP